MFIWTAAHIITRNRVRVARLSGSGAGHHRPAQAGSPLTIRALMRQAGSIHARAGGPETTSPSSPVATLLSPRRRGNLCRPAQTKCAQGPIPATAGNRDKPGRQQRRLGPIPAEAGEPRLRPTDSRTPWAYPRAGGGTMIDSSGRATSKGLSPRGRGNSHHCSANPLPKGPIPATAGEPRRLAV